MAAGNRKKKKHLEFTFARREVYFLFRKFRQMFLLILTLFRMLKIAGSHFEDIEQLCHNHPPDVTHDEN